MWRASAWDSVAGPTPARPSRGCTDQIGFPAMNRDFSRLSLVMVGWLIVQFLLGMATNLFVDITRDHPGANPPEYFSGVAESVTWSILHGPVLLQIHAVLGLVLLIGAVSVFARAL